MILVYVIWGAKQPFGAVVVGCHMEQVDFASFADSATWCYQQDVRVLMGSP
jgi:hypothetical protein